MQYMKPKTASKLVVHKGEALNKIVLETMHRIASIVGTTLGPNGCPVLIEDGREGMPMIVTKDGVTVFQSLAFHNPIEQAVLEAVRSASVRTATEAGDGTTTATILADAVVSNMIKFIKKNPHFSPQKGLRVLQKYFNEIIEPSLRKWSIHIDSENGKDLLRKVASLSANGDADLANAIMQCFDITGDYGNITVTDSDGNPGYRVEKVNGYTTFSGYADSCKNLYSRFINDEANHRVFCKKPTVLLFHGSIVNEHVFGNFVARILDEINEQKRERSLVVVAHGFSDSVLSFMAVNTAKTGTLDMMPVLIPQSNDMRMPLAVMEDLAALSNSIIMDPVTMTFDNADILLEDLGYGLEYVEVFKDKTNFVGHASDEVLFERIAVLEKQLQNPESKMAKILLEERIAKLSDGIARLIIYGTSPEDIRERKDRADDAICAVRGTVRHGCLPGGCWALLRLAHEVPHTNEFLREVLVPALERPFEVLTDNLGLDDEEVERAYSGIVQRLEKKQTMVFNAVTMQHEDPIKSGVLDSTSAVVEALRNSLSIAGHLGILGGIIVFPRDRDLELQEAQANESFKRSIEQGEIMKDMSHDYGFHDEVP